MKKQKFKVEIEIWGIEVEETSPRQGWYKFEYSLKINGGKKQLGQEDGSWSSQTKEHFIKELKNGWASTLVLQRHF